MAKWWESRKPEEGEGEGGKLPKEIQEQLDLVKGLQTTVQEQGTKLAKLDSIEQMLAEERAERIRARAPKPTVKTPEDEQAEREEISALLLTDPEAAYARLASRTNAGVQQLAANIARREVFEDQPDKFPYYTGDIKAEINKIISSQTLNFQTNHEALENTYYTVIGKRQKDISEGKIKDRFASNPGSGRGTALNDGSDDKKHITPNEDIIKISKQLGMSVDDYVKLLEEDVERYI